MLSDHLYRLIILSALLAFWAMGLATIKAKSLTPDEPFHIIRSVAIQQRQDFRLQFEHTPLNHWISRLLLPKDIFPQLDQSEAWQPLERTIVTEEAFAALSDNELDQVRFLTRLPITLVGLLLICTIAAWSTRLGGTLAGLIATLLGAFSPNLIAHSALATTDLTAAASLTVAAFSLWHFQNSQRSWTTWLFAAVCLGIGLSGKMTNLILLPIWFVAIFFQQGAPLRRWGDLIGMGLIGGVVLWGFYRFGWGPITTISQELILPAGYFLDNLIISFSHVNQGHAVSYFWGQIKYNDGWLAYFPVAFTIKTQLPFLILLITALVTRPKILLQQKSLWMPVFFVLAVSIGANLNIGFRHILPVMPLLFVFTAVAISQLVSSDFSAGLNMNVPTAIVGVLLVWMIGRTVVQHPNHLSFFNELIGGSANGHLYLADSNLDWGQDLFAAEQYLDTRDVKNGMISPSLTVGSVYRLDYPRINLENADFSAANPSQGTYIIGYNRLKGIVLSTSEINQLNWFKQQEPIDTLNDTMVVYQVDEAKRGSWIAHCPVDQLDASDQFLRQLVNAPTADILALDCADDEWGLPKEDAGWLLVPQKQIEGENWELVYFHEPILGLPEYFVYFISNP